ncbi:MAG: GAF domain-containing sensor histidine kinase [Acidimicrobiia bacterium]
MTATAPLVAPAMEAPAASPASSLVLVPLVGAPLVLAAAALWVLADADRLDAAAIVRGLLVVAFAFAGRAAWRQPALRVVGGLALGGLGLASLEFLCSAIDVRYADADLAGAVASFAAPLVLAVAFHALSTLPDGRVASSSHRSALALGYAAALAVGAVHWLDRPDPSPWSFVALGAALAVVGLGISHRRYVAARGLGRQRMQWLGLALALVAETAVVVGALDLLVDWPEDSLVVVGASLGLVAAALAAASSPRLVSRVDRLLTHAVSGAGLTAVVVGVYVVVVVGLGRVPSDDERSVLVLSMVAAAVAALLYLPARDRLTVVADRLVYGELQDPAQALDTFGSRMTRALPMEELLLQLAELSKKHFGLRSAEVWTGVDGRLARAASVPDTGPGRIRLGASELPVVTRAGVSGRGWAAVWLPQVLEGRGDGPLRIAPMTHSGQLFGLLVLERPAGDDEFSEEDDRVLTELARQVGLALQNSELDNALKATLEEVQRKNAELQESRARIVASGDAERRKIERNLHDGAQQHLVALAVKLRLIQRVGEANPEQALAMVEEARSDVLATVEELRALAHGIYPPLLMDRGLPEALQAAAGRAVLPTTVAADGVERYDQEVEAAVYFCILEALQNAGKHAGEAATVAVEVAATDDELRFSVVDDGAGFDLSDRSGGHGFVNMGDRLGAIGGAVEVWSAPGQGTRIAGRIPAAPRAA